MPPQEGLSDEGHGSLPWVGISSHGLIAILSRWALAAPRGGGLAEPKARAASSELLIAILGLAKPDRGGHVGLSISIETDWRVRWPRPPDCSRSVTLRWDAAGQVDLIGFFDEVRGRFPASRKQWWHQSVVESFLRDLRSFTLFDVFCAASTDKRVHHLFKQLVWGIGQLLEGIFRGNAGRPGLKMQVAGFAEVLDSGPLMDRKLVQYVMASKRVSEGMGLRSYSICTDKASVGGLGGGLQNTVIGLGQSNIAIFGIPQVGWVPCLPQHSRHPPTPPGAHPPSRPETPPDWPGFPSSSELSLWAGVRQDWDWVTCFPFFTSIRNCEPHHPMRSRVGRRSLSDWVTGGVGRENRGKWVGCVCM